MSDLVRVARPTDIPTMVELLKRDADRRHACNPSLWPLARDAPARIAEALAAALGEAPQPSRQTWLVAESAGRPVGLAHVLHVPVPPIYLGADGPPGLVMPEIALAPDAEAARAAEPESPPAGPRPAGAADLPGIVARSAEHREILETLHPFWRRHPEADPRFEAWMRRSLALADRDMRVGGAAGALDGYLVAQPASRLHFPPAHDISGIGVIDDFHHRELADPETPADGGGGALALLRAGEAAFAARGVDTAVVVCPAAWRSKLSLLREAGYRTAMVWSIRSDRG